MRRIVGLTTLFLLCTLAWSASAQAHDEAQEEARACTGTKPIFVGIMGGSLDDIFDDDSQTCCSWADQEIRQLVEAQVPDCRSTNSCDPRDLDDLTLIAHSQAGGLPAIAFLVSALDSRSVLFTPGSSELVKTDIDAHFAEGDRVYAGGFSVGGGDLQNLLEKLKVLAVPVLLSSHIDSVEFLDGDALIPDNTAEALGFHQDEQFPRGESNLVAEDGGATSVSNTLIESPQGPSGSAHRNMDNDDRVWLPTLARLVQIEVGNASSSGCTASISDTWSAQSHTIEEALAALESSQLSAANKRTVRNWLAALENQQAVFDAVVRRYSQPHDGPLATHLQAVLTHIRPTGFEEEVERLAEKTEDSALCIALVYSLRGASPESAAAASLERLRETLPTGDDRWCRGAAERAIRDRSLNSE